MQRAKFCFDLKTPIKSVKLLPCVVRHRHAISERRLTGDHPAAQWSVLKEHKILQGKRRRREKPRTVLSHEYTLQLHEHSAYSTGGLYSEKFVACIKDILGQILRYK